MTLAKHYGFGPGVVANMTLAQQYLYIDGLTKKQSGPGRVTFDNLAEALEYRQQRQAM